jgi:hypothetical protein
MSRLSRTHRVASPEPATVTLALSTRTCAMSTVPEPPIVADRLRAPPSFTFRSPLPPRLTLTDSPSALPTLMLPEPPTSNCSARTLHAVGVDAAGAAQRQAVHAARLHHDLQVAGLDVDLVLVADLQGAILDHGLDQRQQVVVGFDGESFAVAGADLDLARQRQRQSIEMADLARLALDVAVALHLLAAAEAPVDGEGRRSAHRAVAAAARAQAASRRRRERGWVMVFSLLVVVSDR